MKMQFWAFNTATAKVENVIFIWQAGTISRVFHTVLAVQEVRFSSFRFIILLYKKLYRKQPAEFIITEHIFLKIEFLKGGTLLYLLLLSGEKLCFNSKGYFKMIKCGTFMHTTGYDQRVVEETSQFT